MSNACALLWTLQIFHVSTCLNLCSVGGAKCEYRFCKARYGGR